MEDIDNNLENIKSKNIAIKDLSLWDENARFPDKYFSKSEEELVNYFLSNNRFKIEDLCKSIVRDFDLPQIEKLVVYDDGERYIVLEGNRRLTAYKLLLNPELTNKVNLKKTLKNLKANIDINENYSFDCLIVEQIDQGLRYVSRKHNEGNNEVPWGETERAYHAKRMGSAKKDELLKIALSKLIKDLDLPESTKEDIQGFGYVSTFYRIIKSSPAWNLFGYELNDQGNFSYKDSEFKEKLRVIIINVLNKMDFYGNKIDSRTLNKNDEINKYLSSISSRDFAKVDEIISIKTQENLFGKKKVILGSTGKRPISDEFESRSGSSKRGSVKDKPSIFRKKLPSSLSILIRECYGLDHTSFPNAKLALTRVTLECALKYVVENTKYDGKKNLSESTFFRKAFYDRHNNKLNFTNYDTLRIKFIEIILAKGKQKAFENFDLERPHQIIHNYDVGAIPYDAKSMCNNLIPLLEFLLQEETDLLNSLNLSEL